MAHNNTVLAQFLKLVPRHEFERDAAQHHKGRKLRKMTRWNQFVSMFMAQLSGAEQPARHRGQSGHASPQALPLGGRQRNEVFVGPCERGATVPAL